MSYATLTDLVSHGIPVTAFGLLTDAQKQAALDWASAHMDSFLRNRYSLPLSAWGVDVIACCVHLAVKRILDVRGIDPVSSGYQPVLESSKDALDWLARIQRNAAHPNVSESIGSTPRTTPKILSTSVVATNSGVTACNRGW